MPRIRAALALLLAAVALLAAGCATGFTGTVKNVTTSGVTLNGDVASNRTEQGTWWFEYGAGTGPLDRASPTRQIGFAANQKLDVSERLEGLRSGTPYRYRLCAKDQEPGRAAMCGETKSFTTAPVPDLRMTVDPPQSALPAGLRYTVTNPGPATTGPAELDVAIQPDSQAVFTEVALLGHQCRLSSPRVAICQLPQLTPGAHDFIFEYGHSFPAGATVEIGAIVIQPNVNDEPDTENNKAVSRVVPAP